MKKLLLFLFVLNFSAGVLNAQQDVNYSHFMFNRLAFNPAYAGSKETLTIGAIYRHQWQGIQGAPRTGSVYAHTPFMNGRSGAGLSVTSDHVGMMNNNYFDLSYAYRIPTGDKGTLSLGLSGRLEMTQIDWTMARALDIDDQTIMGMEEGRSGVNFGAGAYYTDSKFYIGLSAPMLVSTTLYDDTSFGVSDIRRQRSYYLMTGYSFTMSENVDFRPGALLTLNPNAPFETDINASFVFMDTFLAGASYRLGDSFDAVIQYKFAPEFKAGFAFDFTTTELQTYSDATFEIMLEYMLDYKSDGVDNIRFF